MKEQLVYLGVDIAKSHLDVAIGNEKRRFTNDALGHAQLIKWVKRLEKPVPLICEPSGGYERVLVRALLGAQLKVSLVPANRVRQFARAAGILAKTDRIDAEVLYAFGEAMRPQTIGACELEQEHLRELESTPAFNASLGYGAESSGASARCVRAEIKSQFDQPDQKAD